MHTIQFQGKKLRVQKGENLRKAILRFGLSPYNEPSGLVNCRGLGTCGTCSLKVKGKISPPTRVEKWRLNFPPHQGMADGLRLACQCKVEGDLEIEKGRGFWGEKF
jgi:ferredoxin